MAYIRPVICFALLILTATNTNAAIVLFEDFETTGSARQGVVYVPANADAVTNIASNSYFGVVQLDGGSSSAPQLSANTNFSNVQGNNFYALQDINGAAVGVTSQTLEWSGINVSGLADLNLSLFIAEDDATDGNEDWDGTDSFQVLVQLDNGGFNPVLGVESVGSPNQLPTIDGNLDGTGGDGISISDTFQLISTDIAAASTLDIRLQINNLTALDEDIAFDNIMLTTSTAVPEPSTLGLFGIATITLWTRRRRSQKNK